jgi:hypothetical protein
MTELSHLSSILPQTQLTLATPITASEFNGLLIEEISSLRKFARKFNNDQQELNDLVQDTLVRALRFWDKFRPGIRMKTLAFPPFIPQVRLEIQQSRSLLMMTLK